MPFDAATSGQAADGASSLTFSHTCGSGSNRVLIVTIGYYAIASTSVSGVTYGGVAMTLAKRQNNGTAQASAEIWRLVNPAAGANNVVVTIGVSVGAGNILAATAISFTDIDQTTPLDGVTPVGATVTGSHSSQSDSITPSSNSAWIVDAITTPPGLAQNGAQALAGTIKTNTGANVGASYRGPISPAASTAMAWTWTTSSTASSHVVIVLRPMGGGGGTSHVLAGLSSGVATSALALYARRALAGTGTGAAVASGSLTASRALSGSSAGAATASGVLSAVRALAGAAAGVGSTVASFGGVVWQLASTAAGAASSAATLAVRRALAGISQGASTATGAGTASRGMGGAVAGTASATAGLSMRRALAGIASGIGGALASFGFVTARGTARISDRAIYSATVSDGRAGCATVTDTRLGNAIAREQ